jgi:exosortase
MTNLNSAFMPGSAEVRPRVPAWALAILFLLLSGCYAVVLWRLGQTWFSNEDMSHGPFVPVLIGYILWRQWPRLAEIEPRPNLWGLPLLLLGAAMLCIGPPSLPTFVFMTRLAFCLSLVGALLYVLGTTTVRSLAYPLLLMLLMIPLPGFILERLTLPLQFVASTLAEWMLDGFGVSVLREGNILHVPRQSLEVAEACSGIRSLFSLLFLGQAYVYLFDDRSWMRWLMAALTLPIAVLANGGRIVSTALLGQYNEEWMHGLVHESTGWIVFVIAFACFVSIHVLVSRVVRRVAA